MECQHQVEPDPAEEAERYGAERRIREWRERLICWEYGSRDIDSARGSAKPATSTDKT